MEQRTVSTQVETGEREILVLEDAHIRPMMGLEIEGGRCAARDTFHAHGREPVRRDARLQRTVRGLTANARRETEHIDAGASLAEALTPSSRGKLNGTPCRSEDEMTPLRAQYCAAHGKPQQRKPLRYGVSATSCKLGEGRTVFAYANNHYQNHSPSTVERFLELRRGER